MSSETIDVLVRGGTVYSSSGRFRADLAIKDGKFVGIGLAENLPQAERVLDARGLCVLPGIWHPHCHFREPGHTNKEDFESGTRAAAAGGITFCVDQTNTDPHPTTLENFEAKRALVEGKAHIDFGLNGGGLYPEEIASLARAGAISIKIFNTRHPKEVYPYISDLGVVDHGLMYEIFEATADAGLMVSVHHDDVDWVKRMVYRDYIDKGRVDRQAYMEAYEKGYMYGHGMVAGLAASAYYARLAEVPLYVLHVGMMPVGAYDVLRFAKAQGQEIYGELEASSALMPRSQAEKVGPFAMVWAHSPEAAWDSVHDGTTDVIVTEHAPHTREEFEPGWQDNFSVPLGQTGVQEFLPLMLTQVNAERLTLEDLVRFCSENPARIFGQFPHKGAIQVGSDADLTLVDMDRRATLTSADMHSKTGLTSWEGMEVTGMPVYTVVRGRVVMDHGEITSEPGYGKFVPGAGAGRTAREEGPDSVTPPEQTLGVKP